MNTKRGEVCGLPSKRSVHAPSTQVRFQRYHGSDAYPVQDGPTREQQADSGCICRVRTNRHSAVTAVCAAELASRAQRLV